MVAEGGCEEERIPLTARRRDEDVDVEEGPGGARDLEPVAGGEPSAFLRLRALCGGLASDAARHRWAKVAAVASLATACACVVLVRSHAGPASSARDTAKAAAAMGLVDANITYPDNWGADCWKSCNGAGLCPDFCGRGNACCRYGSTKDPPECHGIVAWGSLNFHTCIKPISMVYEVLPEPTGSVLNWGTSCWQGCHNESGFCDEFCGIGNACCRFGDLNDPAECHGILEWGSKDMHTCVKPVNPAFVVVDQPSDGSVLHWAQDCLAGCGNEAGYCQEYCGVGNACCHFGSTTDPPECQAIIEWGTKDAYTCVAPAHPDYKVALTGPGVPNWGLDCFAACNNEAGYCQEFCGMGNACCLFTDEKAPPECHGIRTWGAKDRHTCVKPINPVYQVAVDAPTAQHWGEDCFVPCKNRSGFCTDYCGTGKACCLFGAPMDAPECNGIAEWGSKDRYTCVAPANPVYKLTPAAPNGSAVLNWGSDCWNSCNQVGGACPGFCGKGNACCRFGSTSDPPECHGILEWGSKEHHTCVEPVAPTIYVNHLGEDCLGPCNGTGFCEAWCGEGNACCRFYSATDPAECRGVMYWPAHDRHTCVRARGPDPGVPSAPVPGGCLPGQVRNKDGSCQKASQPELMTFYMYQAATDDRGVELENANLGNVEGVLWYLHNDVIETCPRKHNINRILRYVVSVKNPPMMWEDGHHSQFGQFVFFDQGTCMFNNSQCATLWQKYGFVVGCSTLSTDSPDLPNYAGPPAPVLFSLPGGQKVGGGRCQAPDGTSHCTWTAEYAGEIRIDELSGITNNQQFCEDGNVEYDVATDQGFGTTFWNERRSLAFCMKRTDYVKELFRMKYPNFPGTLGEPSCDWTG